MTHDLMSVRTLNVTGLSLRTTSDGDGRTIDGIAVPFGKEYELFDGYAETIDPDCDFGGRDVKLAREHGELIGRVTGLDRQADGLHITARLSDTQAAREAAQLIDDGVYDAFSIGFRPKRNIIEERDDGTTLVHRVEIELYEVSVTGIPAYPDAHITGKRAINDHDKEGTPMAQDIDDTRMSELEADMRDIKAQLATADTPQEAAPMGAAYRSAGEYLKALADGDPAARDLMAATRDMIAVADTGNTVTWIRDQYKLIEQRRKITNLLSHEALPPTGMSMEYNVVATDTTTVGKQATEGDQLAFGKLTFGTKSVPINTYGGYTPLSKQVIDRATTPMLSTALRALTNAYAKATETAVRDAVGTAVAAASANEIHQMKTYAAMTPNDWAGVIMDAAAFADDHNTALGTLLVTKDIALSLISLTDTGDRFLDISGRGATTLGSFDLTGIVGELLRVPVHLWPGTTQQNTAVFLDPAALTVWESGGPMQLSDSDATHLTDSYSVYGYLAVGVTEPNGIIPVTFESK